MAIPPTAEADGLPRLKASICEERDPVLTNAAPSQLFGELRNRPLMLLMLGHYALDCHAGLLPIRYPLPIDPFCLQHCASGDSS